MEGKPSGISRLKVPTKITKPSVSFKPDPLREIAQNKSHIAVTRRPGLSRRSKSFSDLRPNPQTFVRPIKPLGEAIAKKIPPVRAPLYKAPTSSSATCLRKRPLEQPPQSDIKPKVSKPAKPAPYDFKARYNLLAEKHKTLIESIKDLKEKFSVETQENETIKRENLNLENKLQAVQKDRSGLKQQLDAIVQESNSRKQTIESLKYDKISLEEKLSESETHVKTLLVDLKNVQSKLEENSISIQTLIAENALLNTTASEYLERIQTLEGLCDLYKNELRNEEDSTRSLLNMVQDLKGNIRVFCRVRPALEGEEDRLIVNCEFPNETTIALKKSKESVSAHSWGKTNDVKQEFTFDRAFPPESAQEHVFEDLSQLIQSALDGYHVCVFAYGQTGSGKTFTMQGDKENLGMIPRSIDLLFTKIEHMKIRGWTFQVQASFLEIYNETVVDLLNPNDKLPHEIRHNDGKGSTVTNLRVEYIDSPESLSHLMFAAQENRAVASTNYNERSSRSHAVTKIAIDGFQASSNLVHQGSLNLVDLAGSESAKTSSADRIVETKNINKSLSTLGNVMLALHNKESHIPYRNSKLTYLLQSCLGGNSKTLMFVNISPFEDCYNETINSLRFASKVKEVKTNSTRNRTFK